MENEENKRERERIGERERQVQDNCQFWAEETGKETFAKMGKGGKIYEQLTFLENPQNIILPIKITDLFTKSTH